MKVIVAGAGLSGLCAAYELGKDGHEVTVLESRDRVGGAAFSPGGVDLGGQLISAGGLWCRYAEEFGIPLHELKDAPYEYQFNGRRLNQAEADEVSEQIELVNGRLLQLARQADINVSQPWLTPEAAALDSRPLSDLLQELFAEFQVGRVAREIFLNFTCGDFGRPAEEVSALAMYCQIAGGNYEKFFTECEAYVAVGGAQQLAQAFAERLPPGSIRFGVKVKSVDHTSKAVRVTLDNGEVVFGRKLIVALPPSILKSIDFVPEIPGTKLLGMGHSFRMVHTVREWPAEPIEVGGIDPLGCSLWLDEPKTSYVSFGSGPNATRLSELSDEELKREVRESGLLTGLPIAATRHHNFIQDEHTKGAYPCPGLNEIAQVWEGLLGERQFKSPVVFCGAWAHSFFGYMEAALITAWTAKAQVVGTR